MKNGALHGVVVLDFTRMLSGPFCSMLLADQGAEVIKIEPLEGDTTRGNGPYMKEDTQRQFGGYFQSINRNKKSIALDLKQQESKKIVRHLASTCHVVVENFRPGVMDRLGIGYADLSVGNPALVYAAVRGFGDPASGEGPYTNWPAYDAVAQAVGGLMGITGPDADTPTKVGPGIGDILPGTMTAFGILAALHHASRTGEGQFLDVAMSDAVLALCERIVYQHSYEGTVPVPEGNGHPIFAPFGNFHARDGWVAIAVPNDEFWAKLCQVMDRPDLADDPRCNSKRARAENRAFINDVVARWVSERTKAELSRQLGGRIPFGPVQTAADIFADPHVAARRMLAEIDFPEIGRTAKIANTAVRLARTPGGVRCRAPQLGEHTEEVLGRVGYTPKDVAVLRASGVVR